MGRVPSPIDAYLEGVPEPARTTLRAVRASILRAAPDAEEIISYRVCAFRVRGQVIAGFGAFARHCSYFPFSGSVLSNLDGRLEGSKGTKSALHFPLDRPLPDAIVRLLVGARMAEAFGDDR